MGATAVVAMAECALPAPEPATRRPLHPFFAQNRNANKSQVESEEQADSGTVTEPSTASSTTADDENAEHPGSGCKKRRQVNNDSNGDEEPTKPRTKKARTSLDPNSKSKEDEPEVAENAGLELAGHNAGLSCDEKSEEGNKSNEIGAVAKTPITDVKQSQPSDTKPKPRTLMLFNPKTGTLGPPPKPKGPKIELVEREKKPPGKRGRKPASKVVTISYGTDSVSRNEMGKRINDVLSSAPGPAVGCESSPSSPPRPTENTFPEASTNPQKTLPNDAKQTPPISAPSKPLVKSTHPFFLGKVQKKDAPSLEDTKTTQLHTPPKAVKHRVLTPTRCSAQKLRLGPSSAVPMFQLGARANVGIKFPGAQLPSWPGRGMVHIRGEEPGPVDSESNATNIDQHTLQLASRKSKGRAVQVLNHESILTLISQSLEIPATVEAIRNIDTDKHIPPPPEMRLPQKHFESGSKLQARILPELKTIQPSSPGKGVEGNIHVPRQLARLFDSVRSSLSAFDKSQCETANWAQKYAPISAVEILQPGREAYFLRDWLKALTVQSVDTGSADSLDSKAKSKAKNVKKKRRKRLDGFIVSTDDEDYELNELSEDEADWAPSGSRGILRKTVVRNSGLVDGGGKLANMLVISGPHGCGKTAAVYAAANELGFEVFEINSCSRRSGKDILAKIGNMTKNHHVNQRQSTNVEQADDEETAKDIISGKQSTMNAFFKLKSAGAKKPVKTVDQPTEVRDSPKSQRQSLILLEEADILFSEDKQFWATVVELLADSKRPFVVTCNDETLIPLHTLTLHGIFRLSVPPRDLAIDRLLLIAANEGHSLSRQAVETLYDSRNSDLRAATMELQYWCQIGVGDRRGGFDWFYLRWPKGIDLDENKEVVRVISQNTYISGMNFLARDRIAGPKLSSNVVEQELVHQTWESWGLDIANWEDSTGFLTWAQDLEPVVTTPAARLSALEAFSGLADTMSVADICSMKSFGAFQEAAMDVAQPEPHMKAQEDFLMGLNYIDTTPIAYYDSLATDLPSAMKVLAKSTLREYSKAVCHKAADELRPLDEEQTVDYVKSSFTSTLRGQSAVGRMDFAFAFDPIAAEKPGLQPSLWLDPSVFDRTLRLIVLDVAPFVRGIVAYDMHLQKQRRLKMGTLVSEGGQAKQGTKRMRTTRAALSALEGGTRSTTRNEKWFKADLNPLLVAKTAGKGWGGDLEVGESEAPSPQAASCIDSFPEDTTPESSPVKAPAVKPGKRRGRPRKKVVIEEDADADADADEL